MKSTQKILLSAALLNVMLFFFVPAAFAHARPKVMVPAADSVVVSPAAVTVTFTEAVEPKYSSLNVTDESEKTKFNTAASTVKDPKTLTLALPTLPPGAYLVHWVSVATDDGHRMEGAYKFTVK
jgi:methionine-rich copper-binding protein CopC